MLTVIHTNPFCSLFCATQLPSPLSIALMPQNIAIECSLCVIRKTLDDLKWLFQKLLGQAWLN
jgi:hypothetical protein